MTAHPRSASAESARAEFGAPSPSPAGLRRSARSTRVRRGVAALIAVPVTALTLTSCFANPLGGTTGGGGGDTSDGKSVGFDGVQSATIQIESVGTFVTPEGG